VRSRHQPSGYPGEIDQRDLASLPRGRTLGPCGGQPVSRSAGMFLQKPQRLFHAGVLTRGTQRKSVEQAEKRGAMALVGAPHEREVVAARMRQVRLAGFEELVPSRSDQRVHGREALVDRALLLVSQEHPVQGRHQSIGALDGRGPIVVQRSLGGIVNVLHAADEHLAQVVECTGRLDRQQRYGQSGPLARFECLHSRGVERLGFLGEVAHLHRWDVGQGSGADHLRGQPALASDQVAQVAQRRIGGVGPELVPGRAQRGEVGAEQALEAPEFVLAQSGKDALVHCAHECRADAPCGPIECVESWQLEALSHQLFDGHVDQIFELMLGAGSFGQGADHGVPCGGSVRSDLQVIANGSKMALLGTRAVVCFGYQRGRGDTSGSRDVLHNRLRRLRQRHRSTEALVQLQQHEESELRRGPLGHATGKCQFVWCGSKRGVQITSGRDVLEARIGGVLDTGHGGRQDAQRKRVLWHRLSRNTGILDGAWYSAKHGGAGFLWQAGKAVTTGDPGNKRR